MKHLKKVKQSGFVMKSIQLIPLQPAIRLLLLIGFPTVLGFLVSVPIGWADDPGMTTVLSPFLALLAWSVFHLIEPVRHGRKWEVAEFIVVPIGALLLILSFYCLCYQIHMANLPGSDLFQSLRSNINIL